MDQSVQIELTNFPVTVIVKRYREDAGALYEVTETRRWLSPSRCAKETQSVFLRLLGQH